MPKRYKVKAGDTLSKIAGKLLGDPGRWVELAALNGLSNPNRIKVGQTLILPAAPGTSPPEEVDDEISATQGSEEAVQIEVEGKRVYFRDGASEKRVFLGIKHKKGLYRIGEMRVSDLVRDYGAQLKGLRLSKSETAVLSSVSGNEGNLDAINTWDNAFLSFGIFQWTAGQESHAGELPGLLARIKDADPACFDACFGRHGLDVEMRNAHTGWFVRDGRRLDTAAKKRALRDNRWAVRLVRAAGDPRVKAFEVLHAVERLEQFYFKAQSTLEGYALSDLFTSEYAVALILDNHVNRPGHIPKNVVQGLADAGLTAGDVVVGDATTELTAVRSYLKYRETTSMTHAAVRAERVRDFLESGKLSAARGSFVTNRAKRNGS